MIQRTLIFFNRVLFILVILILPLTFILTNKNGNSPESVLESLKHCKDIELIHQVPLRFATYHVQGLDLTDQFYYLTSVDTDQKRGWLFKIDRQDTRLISKLELTDSTLIHPGGIQFDGRYLWIPNAEYSRFSRTMIYGIDENSLEILKSFPVDDHIGAIASDGKNRLYGVNWDALQFYTWDFSGQRRNKIDSPTRVAYQDIKYFAGNLLCSGHKDGDSVIDVIDPENWRLVKRINLPRDAWKTNLTREGMTFDGNLYFVPDDGPESCILMFSVQ